MVLDPSFNASGPNSDQGNLHWVKVKSTEATWQSPACYQLNTSPLVVLELNLSQDPENEQCMNDSRFSKNAAFQPGFVPGMDKDPSV